MVLPSRPTFLCRHITIRQTVNVYHESGVSLNMPHTTDFSAPASVGARNFISQVWGIYGGDNSSGKSPTPSNRPHWSNRSLFSLRFLRSFAATSSRYLFEPPDASGRDIPESPGPCKSALLVLSSVSLKAGVNRELTYRGRRAAARYLCGSSTPVRMLGELWHQDNTWLEFRPPGCSTPTD